MLQLIGWLGCIYLIVKALSIWGSRDSKDNEGNLTGPATSAIVLCWLTAVVFGFMFLIQGEAVGDATSFSAFDGTSAEDAAVADAAMADAAANLEAVEAATDAAAAEAAAAIEAAGY
jgi:hypothetical protein